MQQRLRGWLTRLAWGALIAASALWFGLLLGRPIYYSDGSRDIASLELADAGMWVWPSPEPVCELPGPLQGRAAALPDGRLLYGRTTENGDTDLVLFDPAHPAAQPEPAAALNSRGHDLAPAVAADGTVWFASDRAGGAGGFDLYRSRSLGHTWTPPEPVAACNTMFDETDAAPSPTDGGTVFIRIDRQHHSGSDGVLYHYAGGEFEPEPLFGAPERSRPVDRDPVFSRDGAALWFLRQEGPRARIVRSARLGSVFDAPLPVDRLWGTGALRSPLPMERDRLLLLRPAHGEFGDLLLSSRGREVLPWWHGQRWLEQLLLACIVAAVLLLLLLYLGRRWRSLDLVTLCLLLSLLVHLLLWLWLMGVEIAGSLLPGDDDSGTVQVTLVDSSSGGSTAAGTGDVAQTAQFAPTPSGMQADAPGTAVAAAPASVAASTATWAGTGATLAETERTAELRDAAAAAPARDGADAAASVSAAELAAVAPKAAAAAAAAAARAAEAGPAFRVTVPESGLAAAASGATGSTVAAPAAAPAHLPRPAPASSAEASLRDAANVRDTAALAASPAKSQRDAVGASAQPAGELAAPATSDAAATERSAAASAATTEVLGPEAQLAPARSAAVAQAGSGSLPEPRPSVAGVAAATLRDAAVATAPSSTPTGKAAENGAENGAERAGGAAVALQAAAAASVPEAGNAGAAAPRRGSAEAAAVSAAEAKPGSALTQGPAAAGLARSDTALPLPSSSRGSAPAATLRDAPPAPRDAAVGLAAAAPLAATPGATTPGAATTGAAAHGTTTPAGLQASPLPPLPGATGASTAAAAARAGGSAGRPETAAPPGHGVEAPERAQGLAAAGPPLPLPRARVGGSPAPQVRTQEPVPGPVAAGPVAAGPVAAGTAAPLAAATAPNARLQPARDLPALDGSGGAAERMPTRRAAAGSFQPAAAVPPGSLLERAPAAHAGGSVPSTALASPYSNRFGPQKQKALERFGGTDETERAVRDGLRYLASIQRPDGGWGDPEGYDDKYGFVRIGKTGLCLLAFLGAGHTPKSATEHSGVARRAVDYLVSLQQSETGAFGVSSAYGHGIATYALAECYGLTKDAALRPRVEEGLSWILQHQGPRRDRRNEGGWGYFSPGLAPEDDYARTSITAWMVMALESARISGIELPEEVLPASRRFLELAWDQQNKFFRYNHKRSRLESGWPTLPASTPAGAFCLMLLGEPADSERLRAAVGYTVERRPQQFRRYEDEAFVLRGQGNVYFWYYGTLCCFLAGGDAWKQWNERLSKVLPGAQARDGSWPPIDPYANTAGDTEQDRAYTTSMCVLSLEIYYRYFTPLLLGR